MEADSLWASILDAAVHGSIVPQISGEESAAITLDKIRLEKNNLVKSKAIKSEKNQTSISRVDNKWVETVNGSQHELCVPYDLPSGWMWCRVSNLTENIDGAIADGPFGSNLKTEHYTSNREVRIIQLSNLDDGFWRDNNRKYTTYQHAQELSRCMVDPFDIVIAKMMPAGRATIVPPVDSHFILASDVIKFKPHGLLNKEYLCYAFNSNVFRQQINGQIHGQGRIRTSVSKVRSYLLPIPPVAEQQRIVAKLEKLKPLVKKYGKYQAELSKLNSSIRFVLRKSVLQAAVQGSLVPQDLKDGSASEIIDRISEEKKELFKKGLIKKDKHLSIIGSTDGEWFESVDGKTNPIDVPFTIPDSWIWVRLKSLCLKITDGTHHSPPNGDKGDFMYISAKNIKEYGVDLSDVTYVSQEIHDEIYSRCDPIKGDILFIKDGATTGVVTINDLDVPFSLLSSVALIRVSEYVDKQYIVDVIKTPYFYSIVRDRMSGGAITRVTLDKIEQFLLPLPPLNEQKRIVSKVNELIACIDKLGL